MGASPQYRQMKAASPTTTLRVGLNSWIIADGNYRDFRVDEVRSFALEYHTEQDLRPLPKPRGNRSCELLDSCRCAVTGRTLYLTSRWAVIDVGVLAYRQLYSLTPPPKRFEGEIWLGVDPYFYFERLSMESEAPLLIFDWRIHRIEVESGPRILRNNLWVYDPLRLERKDVEDTREGEDFVLHCELLPTAPRRTMVPI
jgi:hypothetical protein